MRWLGLFGVMCVACYAPTPSSGAPCGGDGRCPEPLVCAAATRTCEREDRPTVDGSLGVDTAIVDMATAEPRSTLIGSASTAVNGSTTAVTLTEAVPAGTIVVVAVAARGNPPVSVTDARANTWTTAVETANTTDTSVAGVYFTRLTTALAPNDMITATVVGTNGFARALAVFRLDDAIALDQVGAAAPSATTMPTVATMANVAMSPEVVYGVIVTGFNAADSYVAGSGFVEAFEFGSPFSSGNISHRATASTNGPASFSVTSMLNAANYAMVIATFR